MEAAGYTEGKHAVER